MFVGGKFVDGRGDDLKTINPATEEPLAAVSHGDDRRRRRRGAARPGRPTTDVWSRMLAAPSAASTCSASPAASPSEPANWPWWRRLDNGKPIKESRDVDVPTASAHFFYHAGWADKLQHAGFGAGPEPLGVAGQVIPWNFPLLMAAWKIAPALAAGNTVVIKPAETTPLSILVLAEIIADADLPPGVVNIVTGAGDIGAALVNHPGIDKVAFTGSTEVGKQIQSSLAGTGRKITLELGGKAANIIFDDAPIDQAVEGIVNGIFFNQGHVCCAGSRLLVQESVADEVIEKLQAAHRDAAARRPDGQEHRRRRDQLRRPAGHHPIADRHRRGRGRRRAGPRRARCPDRGFFFPPTVFTRVSQSMRIAREEIFGPVLSVLTFRTPDEAVAKANNTPYGLSAGVWTEKGSRILGHGLGAAGRRGVGEHLQPVRPDRGLRRVQGVRVRPGGRPVRAGRLPGHRRRRRRRPVPPTPDSMPARGWSRVGARRAGWHDRSSPTEAAVLSELVRRSTNAAGRTIRMPSTLPVPAVAAPGPTRVGVTKTYKLYIGGAFPRSESGRTYPATGGVGGSIRANVAQGSRKDARDAVAAARKAFKALVDGDRLQPRPGDLPDRRDAGGAPGAVRRPARRRARERRGRGGRGDRPAGALRRLDRQAGRGFRRRESRCRAVLLVLHPGADRRRRGDRAAARPAARAGVVIAPIITSGNAAVVIASQQLPLAAVTLAEVLATSDLPGGVVNILTGDPAEIAPHLAAHGDVNALDLTGADGRLRTELERAAAGTVKRVYAPAAQDFSGPPGTARLRAFLEIKTVWHPTGAVSLAGGGGY